MSIIFLILGLFLLFGILMLAAMAVAIWVLAVASVFAFIICGYLTEAIFGHDPGANGFLLGGVVGVLILWGLLAYLGNQKDKDGKGK